MRVVLVQPSLAKYRIPVFQELSRRPGIELKVVYAEQPEIPNVEPAGFDAEFWPVRRLRGGRHPVVWHGAQVHYATRRRADVIVLLWDVHYASLLAALLKARLLGVPAVLWGHGYSKQESRWRRSIRYGIAHLASTLLLYNSQAAQQLVQSGWNSQRVFVAPNSVDQGSIQAARNHWLAKPEELAEFRIQNGIADGPVLLFVSRLDPANGVDLLIKATAPLQEKFPTIKTIVIGKGETELQRLQSLTRELNLQSRIKFLGPIYDEMQLAPWFLSAHVFCYPRNIGLSLLHAFGYGVPVVTSDNLTSQNPEIEALKDNQNGLLYRDGDSDSLTETLEHLLTDTPLRERLSRTAHETATNQFTIKNMVDGMENAIRAAAARHQ